MAPRPAANPRIASVTASGPVQARVPGGEQMEPNMIAADKETPARGTRPIATPAASKRRIEARRLASSAACSRRAHNGVPPPPHPALTKTDRKTPGVIVERSGPLAAHPRPPLG